MGSYCWQKGIFCLLGHRVGWDQVEHAVGVGKELKKYGSQDNLKPQWIREWKLRMYEPVRLVGWKDGAGESAMSRSRAHLLVTHVPVGPLSITHHFPHHYPEAPDVTAGGMFPVGNDFWGCPAKHTTWALRGGVRSNSSSNYSRGHIYWATPTGRHVCPGCTPRGSTGGLHSSIQTPQRAPGGTHPGAGLPGQHPLEKAEPPRLCSHLRTVAKTSHFAHQVAVYQHAAGGERAVHEGEAGQVLHGGGHSPLHGHQLQAAELALPLLLRGRGQRSAASGRAGNLRALRGRHQQEREKGSGNQKMAWEGRMRTRGGGGAKK